MNPNLQILHKNAGSNPEHVVGQSNKTARFQKNPRDLTRFYGTGSGHN